MCASELNSPQNNPRMHMLPDQPYFYTGYTCKPDTQASPSASPARTLSPNAANPDLGLEGSPAVLRNSFLSSNTDRAIDIYDYEIPTTDNSVSPSGVLATNPGECTRLMSPSTVSNPPQNSPWPVRPVSSLGHGKCDDDKNADGRSHPPQDVTISESQQLSLDSRDETWAHITSQLDRGSIKCEYCDSNGRVGTPQDCICPQHAEASVRGRGSSVGDEDFAVWVRERMRESYDDDNDDVENEGLDTDCCRVGQSHDALACSHASNGHLNGDKHEASRHTLHIHALETNAYCTEDVQQKTNRNGQMKQKHEFAEARDFKASKVSSIDVFGHNADEGRQSMCHDEAEIVTLCHAPQVSEPTACHAEFPAALCLKDTGNNSEKRGSPGYYPCAYSPLVYPKEASVSSTVQAPRDDGYNHSSVAPAQISQEVPGCKNVPQPAGYCDQNQNCSQNESAPLKSVMSQESFLISPRRYVDAPSPTHFRVHAYLSYSVRAYA
jgi:hypothetical protein